MTDINPNDVLLGRGGNSFRHSGNKQIRELANSLAERYRDSSKLEKCEISKGLVRHVQTLDPPGRFLKKSAFNDRWEEANAMIAREKASQCLRDAVTALNLSNKKDFHSKPKHSQATETTNVDENEDNSNGYGDDITTITKTPPLDYIEISDLTASMKSPSNPRSHQRNDATVLVPSDVMLRGHQMNQKQRVIGSQPKSSARIGGETRLDDKFKSQAWGIQNEYRPHHTYAAYTRERSSLHQEDQQYLQSSYGIPFQSTPELHHRTDYPVTSSSFPDRKVHFASQRVDDDHIKYSPPSINTVSFDNPTRSNKINIPGQNSSNTLKRITMKVKQDEFHSPNTDMNIDTNISPSSLRSSYSPDNMKLKKQRSFDDFNNLLENCQSTSRSIGSIDSFAKSL